MRNYIFRRLLLLPITVILLSIFVFGLIRLVPGSVIDARLSAGFPGTANADDRAKLEAHFGLDKPVHVQYVNWIGQVFSGDFGTSWLTKEDILDNFGRRMPVTIELLILTLVIYIPLGIGTGVWSAVRQNRADDYGIRFVTILFLAVPNFWLATLVIVVPLVLWGHAPPVPYVQLWEDPGTNIVQMIVPAAIAALAGAAVLGRVARSEMLEVLRQDYVRTAYSKGLADRVVILRHALRNTMIPTDYADRPGLCDWYCRGRDCRADLCDSRDGAIPGAVVADQRLAGRAGLDAGVRRRLHPGQPAG